MFTGLVEMTGVLVNLHGEHLTLRPSKPFADPQYGESVAVNGCCLTLERERRAARSNSSPWPKPSGGRISAGSSPGSLLNIERALRVGDRLGGHIVSGHIDAAAPVLDYRKMPDGDFELRVALPELLAPELVEKGSIAIDGVSLTVIEVGGDFFTVRLIPVTRSDTALVERTPGSLVNLEGDVIGKYVRRQFELRSGRDAGAEVRHHDGHFAGSGVPMNPPVEFGVVFSGEDGFARMPEPYPKGSPSSPCRAVRSTAPNCA